MSDPIPFGCLRRVWFLAGILASVFSMVALAILAIAQGDSGWLPLNATTHAIYGADAAAVNAADWAHTFPGVLIHVVSCFFWAAIGMVLFLLMRRLWPDPTALPWLAGLATALLAGLVDYGVLPRSISPGWELVLPGWAVVVALLALGAGVATGLSRYRDCA